MTPPEDGVQGFDFIALPPEAGSIVRPVLTPVRGEVILPNVDLANFWGTGQPLKGVRVRAATNTKTVNLTSGANDFVAEPALQARSGYASHPEEPPSFRSDIGPMFRERDIDAMQGISGFHLGTLEDVRAHASMILQRLEDGSMPCDGPWPRADVARFRAWIEGGMPG